MMMASDDTDPLLRKDSDDFDTTPAAASGDTATSAGGPSVLSLRIKSFQDVEIRIADHSSIAQVKQVVRAALGDPAKDRYLRLICKGRLLAPDSSLLREFAVQNGDVVHAVLAAAGVRGGQQAALARGEMSRRYRGTGVGAGGRAVRHNANNENSDSEFSDNEAEGDEEEGRTTNSSNRSTTRGGFDRLRTTAGMSRSEIAAIRSYFSRHVDRFMQAHPEIAVEAAAATGDAVVNDPRRRRWLYEDAWMQAQGPTSEFRFNLSSSNANTQQLQHPFLRFPPGETPIFRAPAAVGTDRDFLWGFLLGFFVGFLMLVWVWMPTVPHKQKLGILTGISCQMALNCLKENPDEGYEEDEFGADAD